VKRKGKGEDTKIQKATYVQWRAKANPCAMIKQVTQQPNEEERTVPPGNSKHRTRAVTVAPH